jgi:putative oxygen-independent coproporphyrinogen III oxidase
VSLAPELVAPLPTKLACVTSPPAGLYVHVPFCVSVCPYCDFVVNAGRATRGPESRVERFVAALEVELRLRADALDATWGRPGVRPPLETLYLGGGTPSLLLPTTVQRLLTLVRERYGLADDAEVTLEANPGADERGNAKAMLDAGVTRLSIGAQSFDPGELRALGRRHSPGDTTVAVREARAAGFRSISLDLLYDVPGQTLESWGRTLDMALALEPDHVSAYALTLDDPDAEGLIGPRGDHLRLRRGARQWRDHARQLQDDDRAAEMYELADELLSAAGFGWYEISNWARPGHRSHHNVGYWHGRAWEALGPGAHAFDGQRRSWNAAPLDAYLDALVPADGVTPSLPPGGSDEAAATAADAAILALRTSDGLAVATLDRPGIGATLTWSIENGLLERVADRLTLTRRGRLLSNEVFARLI